MRLIRDGLPVCYQFPTFIFNCILPQLAQIILCKTSLDPIWVWLTVSDLGETNPVWKQDSVHHGAHFWTALDWIQHVYWEQGRVPAVCTLACLPVLQPSQWHQLSWPPAPLCCSVWMTWQRAFCQWQTGSFSESIFRMVLNSASSRTCSEAHLHKAPLHILVDRLADKSSRSILREHFQDGVKLSIFTHLFWSTSPQSTLTHFDWQTGR